MTRSLRARVLAPGLGLAAVVLVALGVTRTAAPGSTPADLTADPGPTATTRSAVEPPREVRAPWRPGAPRRVTIPALAVDAPVVPVGAPGGTLVPPADAGVLGWWAPGAPAGAARGSTLVAGHTVHDGGGALDDLEQVRPGDTVVVRTGSDRVTYRVRAVRTLAKSALARRSSQLFAQDVPGRLVLVTCEDWDGSGYRSNVVVTAVPA